MYLLTPGVRPRSFAADHWTCHSNGVLDAHNGAAQPRLHCTRSIAARARLPDTDLGSTFTPSPRLDRDASGCPGIPRCCVEDIDYRQPKFHLLRWLLHNCDLNHCSVLIGCERSCSGRLVSLVQLLSAAATTDGRDCASVKAW